MSVTPINDPLSGRPVAQNNIVQNFLGMSAVICSKPMQELMELVNRVAVTNVAVLITGESGCGKELVARAIHQGSMRCSKPWVDINCAALPEHLIESELFGYEKGAFSGADSLSPGLFEAANGGTLFLDETGELDMKTQVKLLRVLDGAPYYRLGGRRKVSVDVRIVAATNQDLEDAIGAGRFRADLFHRLSAVQLQVSALRERPEDIDALAAFFLQQHDARYRFTDDAMLALKQYAWPGNIRELRNVVTKAVIFARDFEIDAAGLSGNLRECSFAPAETIDGLERKAIFSTLAQTGGHRQKAAELLGISRRTLTRKLRVYGTSSISAGCDSVAC